MEITEILDDRIRCLFGAFSAEECADFIRFAEGIGFHEAPITTSAGFVMAPEIRNNTRVIHDDERLAASLWERLRPAIPARIGGSVAVGLNERFRFYRYGPGEYFSWHYDGSFRRNDREHSLLTLMVYLDEGFEGGSTDFDVRHALEPIQVVPRRGMVLLFQHRILHRGAPVLRGVKRVLRTDVMYRRGEGS
jgi:predicted 2-oxoglutarate/Fe(II)-dependent dioxygenase YbiX